MKRNLERRRIHFLKDSHYAFYLRMLWKYALWIWETSSDCSGSFAKISKWEDTRMIHSIVSFEPWSVLMSVTPLFRKARKGFTRWKSPTSNALSTEKSAFKRQAETLSLFRIYEYSFFICFSVFQRIHVCLPENNHMCTYVYKGHFTKSKNGRRIDFFLSNFEIPPAAILPRFSPLLCFPVYIFPLENITIICIREFFILLSDIIFFFF